MIIRRTVLLVEDESHYISTMEIAFDSDTGPRLARMSAAQEALLILDSTEIAAVILVLDIPLFGITGQDGRFEIAGVPESERGLTFFHERVTQAALRRAGRRVAISGERVSVPPVAISETGYLSIPHKNMYGQDYAPIPDDAGFYPATHK
jgi:hypothetical protein